MVSKQPSEEVATCKDKEVVCSVILGVRLMVVTVHSDISWSLL